MSFLVISNEERGESIHTADYLLLHRFFRYAQEIVLTTFEMTII